MKTNIVPAQITTVEDKIAGSLTFQQLALLMSPVVIGAISFVMVPEPMQLSLTKIIIDVAVALISGLMAIRVQGKLVMQWAQTILAYVVRSRYVVYDKRERAFRDNGDKRSSAQSLSNDIPTRGTIPRFGLSSSNIATMLRAETLISGSHKGLVFRSSRKGLHVVITESK